MKVYIIDPVSYTQDGVSTGHYLAVAENLVEVFSANYQTWVAGGTIYSQKFQNKLLHLKYDTSDGMSKLRNKWNTLMNIRQVYRTTDTDDILIWQSCSVATVLIGILLFGKSDHTSYLIQYNARMVSNKLFRLLFFLIKKYLTGIICTLDEVGRQFNLPYCVVPDYIYCKSKKDSNFSYSQREYDFSMVGMIRAEKGIVEVARKLSDSSYKVLVAGRPDNDEIRDSLIAIANKSPNLNLKLEYVSEEQYDKYIRSSKYCILNYQGEYAERTSGVVYDVIFKGTPVVGNTCKALSFINENQIGYLFPNLDKWNPSELLDERRHSIYIGNIHKYFQIHESFRQKINQFIQK